MECWFSEGEVGMKAFLALTLLSFCSFFIGGVFLTQADFGGKFKEAFGGTGKRNYNFNWTKSRDELDKEEEGQILVKDLTDLVLDVDMGEVKISPQTKKVQALTYKIKFKGEESPLNFKREGDFLEMSLKYKDKKKFFDNEVEVEIFLPPSSKPLNFTANIKVGSLKLEPGLYFNNFNVDMSAGEMKTEALSFVKGDISLSAGELRMKSTDLKEVELDVAGGSLYLEVINSDPIISADVNAGKLEFGTADGVEKNFTLSAEVSIGELDLVDGYTKTDDDYIYGDGKGRVELEVDLGEVEVF